MDIAKILTTHTRLSSRTRYKTITHLLKVHPHAEEGCFKQKTTVNDECNVKELEGKNVTNQVVGERGKQGGCKACKEQPLYNYFVYPINLTMI
jgi:hypothetical protein